MRGFSAILLAAWATAAVADRPITITFLHNNDLHSHIEPTRIQGKSYGGYARIATLLNQYRASDPNPVFLNAGDVFQGTYFFNVYEGLSDLACLNVMGLQAMAVGNHEFDRGPAVFANFIRGAKFPVLAANLDVSAEPALKGLVKPYAVLTIGGERVGVVGAVTEELPSISSPGPNVKMLDLVASIQSAVDTLAADGVDKIVLLDHCGYDVDKTLAPKLRNVDLIIGGHSHTPLGTPDLPGWPRPAGPYPTVVKDATGRDVYIFQSWEWGKVFGRFKVDFDDKGAIVRVYDATAIPVDESIPEDKAVQSMTEAFRIPIAGMMAQPVGEATNEITRSVVNGESRMANLITDSMLAATRKEGAVVAFQNAGGIRAAIDAGPITFGEAIAVLPFNNTLVLVDLTGAELLDILQHAAGGGTLFPSAGSSYRINGGNRVSTVVIDGQPLDPAKTYRACFNSFTAAGGDAHTILRDAKGRRVDTGLLDIDAFVAFLKANTPVDPKLEGRIARAAQ